MAGAKSGVHVVQLKPLTVVKSLQDGNKFVKWDDDATIGTPVNLRVDKKGFFLYWTDQNNECEVLEISSISDARTGKSARTPNEGKLPDSVTMGPSDIPLEDKTVTVVYGSDLVNVNFIHFCCNSREVAQEWTDELLKMAYNLLALNGASTNFLEKAYTKLCLSAERDKIPVKNIFKTFAQHKDDKKRVERALESCALPCGKGDTISQEKLDFLMFFTFYQHLTCRTEVEKIYESICGSGGKKKGMTTDQLVDFLNNTQRDPRLNEILYPYANHERAKDIIKQYEPNKTFLQKDTLSVDGFLRYLMSDDNAIVAPEKFDQNLDMEQPLSHYFINSSHNTYLTGHQLTGRSSVEIYRQCLLTGCRCVELDCWNGKNSDEEPIITHGYTVVTEILLKEVLEAIAECAFKTSPYPVILSFENHCSPKQQAKMAMYCRKIFGDMLLTDPLTSHPLKPNQALPSPTVLLKKIIIKNKKKHFPRTQKSGGGDTSIDEDDDSSACLPLTPERSKPDLPSVASAAMSAAAVVSASSEEDPVVADPGHDVQDEGGGGGGEPPPIRDTVDLPNGRAIGVADAPDLEDSETESASDEAKVVEQAVEDQNEGTAAKESEAGAEMSALVNYIQPVRFHSFEHAEKRTRSYEISSFVETQATNLLKEYPVEFVNYNKRQLSRIYPKGMRTDSSNYMPQVFWNAGCQMVALNFQTLDLGMQLNLGIFEYNCRTGYLLKPDFMRRNDRKFDLFTESTVDGIIAGTVSVKILSGQFLSDKRVGTYVEVDMYGLPADTVKRRFKTKTVQANGINPIYDEEPFVFKKVVLPELACLRISVYEENGKFIGHRVLPVVGLRPGYRHIQLRNESGQPLTLASLFVLITVKDYIPDGLSELADALANPIAYQSVVEKHAHQLALMTDDDDLEDTTEENKGKRISHPGEGRKSEDRGSHVTVSKDPNMGDNSKMPSSIGGGGASKPATGNANGSVHRTSTAGSTSPLPTTLNRQDTLKGHNTSIKSLPDDNSQEKQPSLLESEEANVKAETLEKIKEHKIVIKILAKLEKDLQLLQKKHEKVREKEKELQQIREEKLLKARESKQLQLAKTTNKLAKKLPAAEVQLLKRRSEVDIQLMSVEHQAKLQELNQSHSQNLCSLSQEQYRAAMELRQKYQEPLYNAIEKALQLSQTAQLEYLNSLASREVTELMKRLEAQTKEDMRNLSKKHKDKSEMERVKRELHQKLIDQAVAERQKINTLLDKKLEELKKQHADVRKRFDDERQEANKKIIAEYDELCEEAKVQYESQCNPNPITSKCESKVPETTEL